MESALAEVSRKGLLEDVTFELSPDWQGGSSQSEVGVGRGRGWVSGSERIKAVLLGVLW
jgi:hypothetical protein